MIRVKQIIENKDQVLIYNIQPNIIWNRFDLRYGDDFDLFLIESGSKSNYCAAHLDGDQIVVSMYLRRFSSLVFDQFYKWLFMHYKNAKSIYILHSYTMTPELESMEHAHVELPKTIAEFDKQLSQRVRYNTKWYPKKIREQFCDYEIKSYPISNTPPEIYEQYKEFKFATHKNIDNVAMAMSTEVWVMYIGSDTAAILQISDTSGSGDAFLVNITYNQKYAKLSVANVLYYALLQNLIERGYKNLFLFKMLDYKRHFNAIGTTTWTGTISRMDICPPNYLAELAKLPKPMRKIARLFFPHKWQRHALDNAAKRITVIPHM